MTIVTISRELGSQAEEIARRVCELLNYRYFDKRLMMEVAEEQGISETEMVDVSEESYHRRSFLDALLRRPEPVSRSSVWITTTSGRDRERIRMLDGETAAAFVATTIAALRAHGRVVVVGRGGQAILRDQTSVLHLRVVARLEDRVQYLMQHGLTRQAVVDLIAERDRAAAQYLQRFHGIDWADPTLYHLTLNTSLLGQQEAAELIATAAQRLEATPV